MYGRSLKRAHLQRRHILAGAFLLSLFSLACSPSQAQSFDEYFKESATRYLYGYLPENDWRWWKAQCYQESRLVETAVSPVGASGVCQLMPGAAEDSGLSWADRFNAGRNIRAGAFILRRNIRTWWPRPTRLDRLKLGWAGYNAGSGHIIRAQSKCDGAHLWEAIAPCLPQVTGRHATETINYVRLIPKWFRKISEQGEHQH